MRSIGSLAFFAASALAFAAHAQQFQLTSPDIRPNGTIAAEQVYDGSGCSGRNVSPALSWSGAPRGTRSFALLVQDPDAPGAGWWHWLVLDIPGNATGLEKDAGKTDGSKLPTGARQLANDFGSPGWGGPCPPPGDKFHRYIFTVYALGVAKLELPANPTPSAVQTTLNAHTLGKATLIGRYGRNK